MSLGEFRELFGDEQRNYGAALEEYYTNSAPADWSECFVSAGASSHPWKDFAETWAHYFHMVDTLETANAFGLVVKPKLSRGMVTKLGFNPNEGDLNRLIEAWLLLPSPSIQSTAACGCMICIRSYSARPRSASSPLCMNAFAPKPAAGPPLTVACSR
jgi:hypothetical protein